MKPLAALLLVVVVTSACSTAPLRIQSSMAQLPQSETDGRYIVAGVDNESAGFLARAGATPRAYDAITAYGATPRARRVLRSLETEYGLREVTAWPIAPLHMHCAVLRVPEGTDAATLLAGLAHDPRLKIAQPLQTFATRTESYNDPYVALQKGFQQMNVAGAQTWARGDGVRVAIIDTGADTEHPDLRGAVVGAANFVDTDDGQFRQDRHGTEIAGVIAAIANNREGIVGVAPGARLIVLKACRQAHPDADAAQCNSFTLARALVAAFDARAQIVNLSIAGPADPLLGDLMKEGMRRGIVFVGAAVPDAETNGSLLHQPGVIEVGLAGMPTADPALLSAPGREILTLLPGGHYDFASGVSLATAQVIGVVALLLSKNPGITSADADRLLRDTSEHAPDAADAADAADGAGRVNACAAVIALLGHGGCKRLATDERAGGLRDAYSAQRSRE